MPIIPLLTQSNPLPDAPAPVLDRERRPTVDNSQVANAVGKLAQASQKPMINGDALAAPFEALGSVGRAVAQTGDLMGALAVKQREAQTFVQVKQAAGARQAADDQFNTFTAEHPDNPELWMPQRQQINEQTIKQISGNEHLTPQALTQIQLDNDLWSKSKTGQTQTAIAQKTFGMARDAVLENVQNAIQNQDREGMEQQLKIGRDAGWLHDFMVPHFKQEFEKEAIRQKSQAEAQAMDAARSNVINATVASGSAKALEDLDKGTFGKFAPEDSEQLRAIIKQTGNGRAAELNQTLSDGIADGTFKDDKSLLAAVVGNPAASPSLIQAAKTEIYRNNNAEQKMADDLDRQQNGPKNFAEQYAKIQNFSPANYKTDEEAQAAAFNLRVETRRKVGTDDDGYLQGLLWRKQNTGTEPPKQTQDSATKELINKRIATAFDPKTGMIPWIVPKTQEITTSQRSLLHPFADPKITQEPITKKSGEPIYAEPDPAKQREAQIAMAKVKQAMSDWVAANPKDANDPVKVDAAIQKALPEGTRFRGLQMMQQQAKPSLSPSATPGKVSYNMHGQPQEFTADATGYAPGKGGIEGGLLGAQKWHGEDVAQEPLYTLEQFKKGKAPYVSVAMDNSASNPLPYGTMLESPDMPGVKFRVMDTGSAFNGQTKKYGPAKGLGRIDIARDSMDSTYQNNGPLRFRVSQS